MARDILWGIRESAVRIGTLWVPGRQVEQTLAKYTKQIFCLTHHEQYPYSFLGSSTAIRYSDQCFLVWCQHQTKGYSPDDVAIPIENGKTIITGSQFFFVTRDKANEDEDYPDLCAMRFDPENYGHPNLETDFFVVRDEELWQGVKDAVFYIFGFPTELRRVEYDEPHVHVTQVVTSGRYASRSNSTHLHSVKLTRTKTFSIDGLSGGPVYHLARDKDGFYIGLAGIVVRGGGDFIYFIDARFLAIMLKKTLADLSGSPAQQPAGS